MNKLKSEFIFFDGAMGTMIQKMGLPLGGLLEDFNFTHPEIIEDIHRQYIEAGADIITTNTFGANELKLSLSSHSVEDVINKAMFLAKNQANGRKVALDIGPIGQLLEPIGDLSFERAYDIFKRQVIAGSAAGADLILIETISDLHEMKAAILAAKEHSSLPVFCTMTFQEDGRTLTGTDPYTMANVIGRMGIDALGVNCSLGPSDILPIVSALATATEVPIIVQPNAGLPKIINGQTVYNLSPEAFAKEMKSIAESGASILGGCCGSTPEFISKTRKILRSNKPVFMAVEKSTVVCSATRTVQIGNKITLIGERINPTGKETFKDALRIGNYDYIVNEAIIQRESGADILDVNVGLMDIDEKSAMIKAVSEIQNALDTPLQIDSTKPEVIESALRICNGKPIINSVTGDDESLNTILPLAKKYGACIIGLTLNERGIPKTAEERLAVAGKIINRALSLGIPKEDILIDCLVLTASAQQTEVIETIKAISLVKKNYGVRTVLGISNVSFGLPDRALLNKTFLSMALTSGLDAPIADPLSKEITDAIKAYRVLSGIDEGSSSYLDSFREKSASEANIIELADKTLGQIIIEGLKDSAMEKTYGLLETLNPMEIINEHLIPALDYVGEQYEKKVLFLPQLIRSAETVKISFGVLQEHLSKDGEPRFSKGRILLATVKGDVHDIGKNIVKILLENYGFDVFDLGKNVSPKLIVEESIRLKIDLVGLSALMTTTVDSMTETIKLLHDLNPKCKIFVGGAVLSPELKDQINADFYGKDARAAVSIAQIFFKNPTKS
jgi:5-methyltetrahydrofolate--homocysteine methyltransferase